MSGIYRGPNGSATADALNIDGDKGDLTISNSGLEWTINPDTVDFSKMQNISKDVLLGRASVGSGNVEEITCTAAGRALLEDVNASAQRATLGLGNAATATIGTDVLAFDSNLQGFVDTFTLPTTDATNGFVLTTNGSGTLSLTAPGGIPDGDKGDISVSSGGTVWTVDTDAITTTKILDDSVTYAKIQNVSATDKLLGRSSSGAGNIEEITCTSAGRNLLDDVDASAQRTTLGLGALALQGDGDKGDITVSGSGATWSIDNDVVSFSKIQNIATSRILGRTTTGSGDIEELSVGSGLTLSAGSLSVTNEAGMVLLATATASASATIDFTSINNTVYDSYLIVGTNVQPANDNVELLFRVSQAGVFDGTPSKYQFGVWRWTSAASGVSGSGVGGGASAISLAAGENLGNASNEEISFRLNIDNCAQTTEIHRMLWESRYTSLTPTLIANKGGGEYTNTGAIDGFRFLMSSGNITSGTFKLYGLKG